MHESLLDGQVRLLEMLVLGEPLEDILDSCLRLCEANSEDMLCSILVLDKEGKRLLHCAAPSLPPEYMRLIDGSEIGPQAGSCGTAAFFRKPVIVEDIATDPLWDDYRSLALPFGLRACWSTPILDRKQRVLGTFAIYYRRPCTPTEAHLHLIGLVTHIAGIAIHCRRAEEKKRQVFERISDAFLALDHHWRFAYVNPQAGKVFGRAPEDLIGKEIWTEFPEAVGHTFHLAYEKAMRQQIPVIQEDFYPPWGKWFENRIYPSPHGLSIYLHDITDRKQNEERLRQSEKMTAIGQLAGGVAHDFNNQLSIILGYAGLLQSRLSDPDLKRFANSILRAADRSGDLTRKLLAFSRQGHLETVPVGLHEMILETIELLGLSIEKNIAMRTDLKAANDLVSGDPATLQNALLNLALNARDAMPEGGVLEFSSENMVLPGGGLMGGEARAQGEGFPELSPGAYLRIAVKDTGTGMSEAVKEHIFEPFFTTKPVGKGTGMGLASVFGTVKTHHGRIAVETALGRGTTFHIYLPLSASALPEVSPETDTAPPADGLRILVVEDEPLVLSMVADMLKDSGHQVLGASGGREALDIYREKWRSLDLIVLDLVMPDMDGYRTFQELRRINPAARVLLSSGFGPEEKIQAALREGALGLLQKPYEKAQLDAMIAGSLA
ncbi:MAG: response regulator [Fibrobacteria bacterium]